MSFLERSSFLFFTKKIVGRKSPRKGGKMYSSEDRILEMSAEEFRRYQEGCESEKLRKKASRKKRAARKAAKKQKNAEFALEFKRTLKIDPFEN